jgi:hypothetical protein
LSAQNETLLRNTLAKIYHDRAAAVIIAKEAGLDVSRLDLTGSSLARCHAIVEEATKQGRLGDLVRGALRAYPEDVDLLTIAALHEIQ